MMHHLPIVPDMPMRCDAGCRECCWEAVPVSEEELLRVHLYANEHDIQPEHGTDMCPWYGTAEGRCKVYEARPTVCRVFGHLEMEGAICPRGYNENKHGPEADLLLDAMSSESKGPATRFLFEVLEDEESWKGLVHPEVWDHVNRERLKLNLPELTRPGETKGG